MTGTAFLLFMTIGLLSSCSTVPSAKDKFIPFADERFYLPTEGDAFIPFSEDEPRKVTIKGKAPNHSLPLNEVCIGMGSGLMGYESVTLRIDGSIEVVTEPPNKPGGYQNYQRRRGNIGPEAARKFLSSIECQKAARLRRSYVTDIHDGSQAFLGITSDSGSSHSHFSNYYPRALEELRMRACKLAASLPAETWSRPRSDDGFTESRRTASFSGDS